MQGPCTFIVFATSSSVVDTAGADVGFRLASLTSSLDSCCLSRSIGHVRCSSFFLAHWWDGSVISSWTHWPSSCQSGVQHHQRRHWSTIFYCSRRVFRGIVIYGSVKCADFREDLMAGPKGWLSTDCGDLTCSKSDTSRTGGPLAVWRGMVACSPVRPFTQELSGDVGPGACSDCARRIRS